MMFGWWCFWSKDQRLMIMMILIERSECDDDDILMMMMLMFSGWCFWSKDQSMMMMLFLIERPKCWRRCCWSKGQSVEDDVTDRKVKVLKMLLIEESRCCWSKRSKYWWCWRLKIEDEGYMMLKRFQWFIDVSPWWC